MALTLRESRAITEISEVLYEFLPGSGNPKWKGHISFKSVAEKVGVGDFWQPGSKTPMIAALLEKTLNFHRELFEPLILEIVRSGFSYRKKRGNPVTPNEIDTLNGLLLEVGFKFPDLWDTGFKDSLRANGGKRAKEHIEQELIHEKLRSTTITERSQELESLKSEYFALRDADNRPKAGMALEKILNRLFALHDLSPRDPFRVIGEQIDGSFELDHEVYLLEAKWCQDPTPAKDLYAFREEIEGKSKYTRGVFISINGISREASIAITKGKQPNFFVVDGYDITMLLEDNMDLKEFLRRRQRLLAEEGKVVVIFTELDRI
jgi:hypothetical protein